MTIVYVLLGIIIVLMFLLFWDTHIKIGKLDDRMGAMNNHTHNELEDIKNSIQEVNDHVLNLEDKTDDLTQRPDFYIDNKERGQPTVTDEELRSVDSDMLKKDKK